LTYLGTGLLTKATEGLGVIGDLTSAVETGWIKAWSVPFDAMRAVIEAVPKTPLQFAVSKARAMIVAADSLVFKTTGKSLIKKIGTTATVEEVSGVLSKAIKFAYDNPEIANDFQHGRIGLAALDSYLPEELIVSLPEKIVGTTTAKVEAKAVVALSDEATSEGLKIFQDFTQHTGEANLKGTAQRMLKALGIDETEESIAKMSAELTKANEQRLSNALQLAEGKNVRTIVDDFFSHVKDTTVSNFSSKYWKVAQQTGQVTAWSRMVDRVVRSSAIAWVDRSITKPMANWYLLFLNLGPFNVLENSLRGMLGGGHAMYDGGILPTRMYAEISQGIEAADYELLVGESRLEQALTAGEGTFAEKGKGIVPGITKPIGKIQVNINVKGIRYPVRTMEDWGTIWGEIGTQQRADFVIVDYRKSLATNPLESQTHAMQDFHATVQKYAPLLDSAPNTISKSSRVALLDEAEWRATVGPDSVRRMLKPLPALENNKAAIEIGKITDRCNEVPSPVLNSIREDSVSGEIYVNRDTYKAAKIQETRMMNLETLKLQTDRLKGLSKIFTDNPPTTALELNNQLGMISDLVGSIEGRASDIRVTSHRIADTLKVGERAKFYTKTAKELNSFLDQVDYVISDIHKSLKDSTSKITLTDAQSTLADQLMANNQAVLDLTRNNVSAINEVSSRMFSTKPKFSSSIEADAWWQNYKTTIDDMWKKHFKSITLPMKEADRIRMGITATQQTIPNLTPLPNVSGNLTPAHVAYIWGGTGGDLAKSLFANDSSMAASLMGREQFISKTSARAMKIAEQFGQNAEQLGFTDEAIGEVYDQMLRAAGLDPSLTEPLTPALMQLNDIFAEVDRQYAAKAIAPAEYDAMQKFVNSVADEVGQHPVYTNKDIMPIYQQQRESSMLSARSALASNFTDYSNQNMISALMKPLFPFWTYESQRYMWLAEQALKHPGYAAAIGRYMNYCVPTTYKALTREGWKTCYELSDEEEILVCNPVDLTTHWENAKINVFPAIERDMLGLPCHINKTILCTPNHRWITRNQSGLSIKEAKDITEQYDSIPTVTNYEFSEESILSPYDALILGWLVTDGYIGKTRGGKLYGQIHQKKESQVEILKELVKKYSIREDTGLYVFYVDQSTMDRIASVYYDKTELPILVSNLSRDAAEAMWTAMMSAEGNSTGRLAWRAFYQKPGPVLDAFTMLSIFLGYRTTVESTGLCSTVLVGENKPNKSWRRIRHTKYSGEVWCPSVKSGTWIMLAEGNILPTGNTDNGYISIPGTDIQINPLKGTVFSGGMLRLYNRDYPEYANSFPGAEIIGAIQRWGFYPGINVSLPLALFGAGSGKPQLQSLLPAWARSGLDAIVAVAPNSIAATMSQTLFPDNYKDYMTILTVSEQGGDGVALWDKMRTNTATPSEINTWGAAYKKATGLKGILFEQTGLFRLKPKELTEFNNQAKQLIFELTGYSPQQQDEINARAPMTGMKFTDLVKLDPAQQNLLYTLDGYQRWSQLSAPLLPNSWQDIDRLTRQYYNDVEAIRAKENTTGFYDSAGNIEQPSIQMINQMLVSGQISPSQWVSQMGDIKNRASTAISELGQSTLYKNVPKTLAEREAQWLKRGQPVKTYSPGQEMIWLYYDQKPQWKYDSATDSYGWDFTNYYAMTDALISCLPEPYKTNFINTIHKDWTPLEQLYWTTSKEYLKPYALAQDLVMKQYTPEQQNIINSMATAKGADRDALLAVINPKTGKNLVSEYNSNLSEIHKNMRYLDPELDAWLAFWGKTSTLQTKQAQTIYDNLQKQYLTNSMIGGAV
jgi:hypothetical protein